jgi:protein O-mannosyl-transferase
VSGEALGRRLAWLALAALAALAYWPGLHGPFVYDDKIEVVGNDTIRFLAEWRAILSYNLNRPLLLLSYALNYAAFGLDPWGYHLTSIGIHLLGVGAALLLAEGVLRLSGHPRPLVAAVLAAGLWGLHPMGAQAVLYVTGRSESLCGAFALAGLAAWAAALSAEARGGRGGAPLRLLGLLAMVGAMASKEVGLVAPLVAGAMELLLGPGPRGAGDRAGRLRAVRWGWYLPLVLLVALGVGLRLAQGHALLPREVDRPLGVQLTTMATVWLRYAGLWLLPLGQTLFHVQPDLRPASVPGALGVVGWIAALCFGLAWGRRDPLAAWALLGGALFLLPSSSVAPLKEAMAEHRAYLTGFFLWLPLVALALRRWGRAALPVALVALGFGLATRGRSAVWADEARLWEEATARAPASADAWYGLGDAHRFAGRMDEAERAYLQALEQDPGHADARVNLGIARAELGDEAGAREAWMEALRRQPSNCKAHNNLGFLALSRRRYDEALSEFRSTLAWCPEDVRAHYGLGNLYHGPRRDPDRARLHYEAVLRLEPTFSRAAEVRERLLELTW